MERFDESSEKALTRSEIELGNDTLLVCTARLADYPIEVRGDGIGRAMRNNIAAWQQIVGISIESKDGERRQDIAGLLPKGYSIFQLLETNRQGAAELSAREGAIRLDGPLENWESLLLLTRAIGEAVEDAEHPEGNDLAKSPRKLFFARNLDVYRQHLEARGKGWEFAWQQLHEFFPDDDTASINRRFFLEVMGKDIDRQSIMRGQGEVHPHVETVRRIGHAAGLLVARLVADIQPEPPTAESILNRK